MLFCIAASHKGDILQANNLLLSRDYFHFRFLGTTLIGTDELPEQKMVMF